MRRKLSKVHKFTEEELKGKITLGLQRGKSYKLIAKETELNERDISDIARNGLGYDRQEHYLNKRDYFIVLMLIDDRSMSYIADKLGLSIWVVWTVRNSITWDKYQHVEGIEKIT